jgi:glycosyltransferase involved in cell wall biosynthesis
MKGVKPKRNRLAVLITHPVQYFQPVFAALALDPRLELLVVFGCDHGIQISHDPDFGLAFAWDCSPTAGFPHVFVSDAPLGDLSRWQKALPLAQRACQHIRSFQPDRVLVFAYTPIFITLCTLLLRQAGLRLMLRADGTDRAFPRTWLKGLLKDLVLRIWYRQFEAVFPIGGDSNDHFARLGVPSHCRHPVSYAVNTAFFADLVRQWAPQREQLRCELGIGPTDLVLLWSAKMTQVKNPLLLIEALRQLPEALRCRFWLVAMGDGPLRSRFETEARSALECRSCFFGFRNQSELGQGYAVADALVFPSQQGETWGLVVNEALQFGLAVLASDHPGCVRDLLLNRDDAPAGSNIFPSGDATALASALCNLATRYPDGFVQTPVISLPQPEDLAAAVATALCQSR